MHHCQFLPIYHGEPGRGFLQFSVMFRHHDGPFFNLAVTVVQHSIVSIDMQALWALRYIDFILCQSLVLFFTTQLSNTMTRPQKRSALSELSPNASSANEPLSGRIRRGKAKILRMFSQKKGKSYLSWLPWIPLTDFKDRHDQRPNSWSTMVLMELAMWMMR